VFSDGAGDVLLPRNLVTNAFRLEVRLDEYITRRIDIQKDVGAVPASISLDVNNLIAKQRKETRRRISGKIAGDAIELRETQLLLSRFSDLEKTLQNSHSQFLTNPDESGDFSFDQVPNDLYCLHWIYRKQPIARRWIAKEQDVDVGEFQLPKLGTIRWQGHTETASRIEPVSLGRTGTHKTNFIVGRGSQAFVDRLPPGTYRLDGPVNRVTVTPGTTTTISSTIPYDWKFSLFRVNDSITRSVDGSGPWVAIEIENLENGQSIRTQLRQDDLLADSSPGWIWITKRGSHRLRIFTSWGSRIEFDEPFDLDGQRRDPLAMELITISQGERPTKTTLNTRSIPDIRFESDYTVFVHGKRNSTQYEQGFFHSTNKLLIAENDRPSRLVFHGSSGYHIVENPSIQNGTFLIDETDRNALRGVGHKLRCEVNLTQWDRAPTRIIATHPFGHLEREVTPYQAIELSSLWPGLWKVDLIADDPMLGSIELFTEELEIKSDVVLSMKPKPADVP
jgi:hypothetical protein